MDAIALIHTGHILLTILIGLVMAIGLIGTIVPVLPGTPVVWVAALGYGLLFTAFVPPPFRTPHLIVASLLLLLLGVLAAIGYFAGWFLPSAGGAAKGASFWGVVFSIVLAIIGFFVIPIIGALIGAALGIFISEYLRSRDWETAWQTTRGVIVGFGLSVAVEMGSALLMVAIWFLWAIANAAAIQWLFVPTT